MAGDADDEIPGKNPLSHCVFALRTATFRPGNLLISANEWLLVCLSSSFSSQANGEIKLLWGFLRFNLPLFVMWFRSICNLFFEHILSVFLDFHILLNGRFQK